MQQRWLTFFLLNLLLWTLLPPDISQAQTSAQDTTPNKVFLPLLQVDKQTKATDEAAAAPTNAATVVASTPAGTLPAATRLAQAAQGHVTVSKERSTGMAGFVRVNENGDLLPRVAASTPVQKVETFFAQYGDLFGITDAKAELQLQGQRSGQTVLTHLTYQQTYQGIPVFGAQLKAHVTRTGRLLAVNGTFVPHIDLDVQPRLLASEAEAVAISTVQNQLKAATEKAGQSTREMAATLKAAHSPLAIYRTGLFQGLPGANHLVYAVEVVNAALSVREFVYVDAHTGKVVDQISGIHHDLDRKVSEGDLASVVWQDSSGDPDPLPAGWADGTAQQVTDWQNEIDGARETYNLFASMTGGTYLSYDGADATMHTVNNDPDISCPNANWNGTSTNYCSGVTGDDTVAHEWGHAYTEYTNNLIYAWQAGALNESYSDIWGEVVDLVNGRGDDAPDLVRTPEYCSSHPAGNNDPGAPAENSVRWLSGEDDPAFGGAIRDMWNPACMNDPGKVSDGQYWCSAVDGGGVHSNSGVPNHAFALMVDGGAYNGQTVAGLGLTKAAHVHWAAQNLLTPASDFADQADALELACSSLIGVNLNQLDTQNPVGVASGETITAADCAEVAKVAAAVEFRTEPTQCEFTPLLDPNAPPLCADPNALSIIDQQDWENGLGDWTVNDRAVANPNTFDNPGWTIMNALPAGAAAGSTQALFAPDLNLGNCAADDESGVVYVESPVITIPAGADVPRVAFDHWLATEAGYDGGNVKVSVNGASFTDVPPEAFAFNPYNAYLTIARNSNPLAGEAAFTGANGGSFDGSWGQSQIVLGGLAVPGDTVQLRFELGVDGCAGITGWYVDAVQTYYCAGEQTQPQIDVMPEILASTQGTDDQFTKPLVLANNGTGMLDWTLTASTDQCATTTDIPWLNLPITSGHLEAHNQAAVDVTFDSTGLAVDTYQASLCISSNDPVQPLLIVPVDLHIIEVTEELVCNGLPVSFDAGIPGIWSVLDNAGNGVVWNTIAGAAEDGNYTGGIGNAATVSSDRAGQAEFDTELRSHPFALPAEYPGVTLTYLANYQNYASLDYLDLDISSDGGDSWTTLLSWNEDHGAGRATPGEAVAVDLSAYAGQSNLLLRWHYYDPNTDDYDWYAQIDDVALTCGAGVPHINVEPGALNASVAPAETTTAALTIGNSGSAELTWSIAEEGMTVAAVKAKPVAVNPAVYQGQKQAAPGAIKPTRANIPAVDNAVQDGSFEAGSPNPFWAESSTNSGTPLCDPGCTNGYNLAADGYIMAWFGGWDSYEEGSLSQAIVIPPSQTTLRFFLWVGICDSAADYFEVTLDGSSVFHIDGSSERCGEEWYQEQRIDISSFADGGVHTLTLHAETFSNNGAWSNFFVDLVALEGTPLCTAVNDVPWLAVDQTSGALAPYDAASVNVAFDAADLTPGTYTAALCVASNDAAEPLVAVPVTLTVQDPNASQVPLYTGWNLVALPVEPADPAPAILFSPIAGAYNLVYAYNGCDSVDPWKKYDPAAPFPFLNDLNSIGVSQGLWVRATQPTNLPVTGVNPANTSMALCVGWNLISWPSDAPTPITTALAGIIGDYSLVYAYDGSDPVDPWKKYDPAAPFPFLNDLHELKPGMGYWLRVTNTTTLVVP